MAICCLLIVRRLCHNRHFRKVIMLWTILYLRLIQLTVSCREKFHQVPNIIHASTAILTQVDYHTLGILILIHQIFQIVVGNGIHKRRITQIGNLTVADSVVSKSSRRMIVDCQIVEHHYFGIDVFGCIHPAVHFLVVRHIKRRNKICMPVVESIQHCAKHIEQTVVADFFRNLRLIHGVNRIPVHILHIEEGILLVNDIPQVFKSRHGVVTWFLFHKRLFARSSEQSKGKQG